MRISLGANQVSLSLLFICRDLITSYIIKKGLNFFSCWTITASNYMRGKTIRTLKKNSETCIKIQLCHHTL